MVGIENIVNAEQDGLKTNALLNEADINRRDFRDSVPFGVDDLENFHQGFTISSEHSRAPCASISGPAATTGQRSTGQR